MSKKLLAILSRQAMNRIITSIVGIVALILYNDFMPRGTADIIFTQLIALVLYSEMLIACYVSPIRLWKKALIILIGFVYIVFSVALLLPILTRGLALRFLACIFCIDVAAYVVGNALKGPKLLSKVSPNKTISGFVGGTIIGAFMFELLLANVVYPVDSMFTAMLIGLAFALIVQIGDLLVSFTKRILQIKDSSNLLPGHGGLWDRCDSVFAGAIFVAFLLIKNEGILLM